ncbi:DUF927 domain-containing protein [Clostridium estertheticum]|uniref:DUF927 domain-containing protein n=1 Tax=Clostridium estertheticum TaxID=238834 RepID=UPI001C7CA1C9|nr:DUF927 domain-containing protein [Clostridium estertheticum]MBX4272106.1 DUF927 domain-containing protein [Clostridium estertheticum]WLC78891.1 DUF927 domain-containing protein [Clostridium estertheticum]
MKIIKKANVKENAKLIPSEAADKLKIKMYVFKRKNFNTLKESTVCAIQFEDGNGEMTQTADISFNCLNTPNFEEYSSALKINIPVIRDKVEEETNCIRDFKTFVRGHIMSVPVRHYYNKGYGWTVDSSNGKVRFDGSSVIGVGEHILDDHEYHLTKKGDKKKTIELCNEVMNGENSTQFLLASSLAAPIFGALDLNSLIVNVSGLSSKGKTTILKLGMSFWSSTDDMHINTSWYNTENSICAMLNNIEGIAFLLDDTSQGTVKNYTNTVYNIEGGKSKGRLNKLNTIDNIETWHTCILSSSEKSMYEKTDADKNGLLRRLIELDIDNVNLIKDAAQAKKISIISKDNYGIVGIEFVKKFFENKLTDNNFEKLRDILVEEQSTLQNNLATGIGNGLAEKLAVVISAAKLAKEYIGLNFDIDDLTEYAQTLIEQAEIKIANTIVMKKDFNDCYKAICDYAKEKLDCRFKGEFVYHIPVKIFYKIAKDNYYEAKELKMLFQEQGVCEFNDGEFDNTARIEPSEGVKKVSTKVITVTKMI